MEYIHGAVWVRSVVDKKMKKNKHILYIGCTLTLLSPMCLNRKQPPYVTMLPPSDRLREMLLKCWFSMVLYKSV